MKAFTLSSVIVLATAATSANAAYCKYLLTDVDTTRFQLQGENVDDIPGICGGLWDNLKRFADCIGVSEAYCGGLDESKILGWEFTVGPSCNGGMVESTWWEATKNNFGDAQCNEEPFESFPLALP